MVKTSYSTIWNLDRFFSGGSQSTQFSVHLSKLRNLLDKLEDQINAFASILSTNEVMNIINLVETIATIRLYLSEARSFIVCLLAENPTDVHATVLQGEVSKEEARFEKGLLKVKIGLANMNEAVWKNISEVEELKEYRFILNEWRERADTHVSEEVMSVISNLSYDGYHAWGHFYQDLINDIRVHITMNGKEECLSIGQAINLRSHSDEEVRKQAYYVLEATWTDKEALFGKIINHITGFRLQVYKKRGMKSAVEEPLKDNRMKQETLNAMWSVVSKHKQVLSQYLNQKAKIMGDSKMKSYNFWAPFASSNQVMTYEEAAAFITEHVSQFGDELTNFVRHAFTEGWIEYENRPNKSAVPFCASFPLKEESRVFVTFNGDFLNILALVHELGHAFHNHAMKGVNGLNKRYPLNIAETASTFAEMIIFDAELKKANSNKEKLFILDEKLKRSVMNFMNMYSRFLFEQSLYREREKGIVSANRLNQLMRESIDEAYAGALDEPSEHSWVWTPHYYITQSPFYNFPYTFGYLFALNLYARAKEGGKDFEKRYVNLLRDSGSMTVEDLIMKYLGEDITKEKFWEKGMALCIKDVEEFIKLTSS